MAETLKIVNRDGDKESFDERKLYASVFAPARQTGYGIDEAEALADDVCDTVVDTLQEEEDNVFTSEEVRENVQRVLREKDEDVAFMYAKFEEMMR